jgi:hypothetical protein
MCAACQVLRRYLSVLVGGDVDVAPVRPTRLSRSVVVHGSLVPRSPSPSVPEEPHARTVASAVAPAGRSASPPTVALHSELPRRHAPSESVVNPIAVQPGLIIPPPPPPERTFVHASATSSSSPSPLAGDSLATATGVFSHVNLFRRRSALALNPGHGVGSSALRAPHPPPPPPPPPPPSGGAAAAALDARLAALEPVTGGSVITASRPESFLSSAMGSLWSATKSVATWHVGRGAGKAQSRAARAARMGAVVEAGKSDGGRRDGSAPASGSSSIRGASPNPSVADWDDLADGDGRAAGRDPRAAAARLRKG